MSTKNAFTMIELIFVILILGILAVVAIPKLSATRDDAKLVMMTQSISIGTMEIASYAIAKGTVENNLSLMSAAIDMMVSQGKASADSNRTVKFKMGKTDDCLIISVTDGLDANLTVLLGTTVNDPLCSDLQNIFDTKMYPIPLKGQRIEI